MTKTGDSLYLYCKFAIVCFSCRRILTIVVMLESRFFIYCQLSEIGNWSWLCFVAVKDEIRCTTLRDNMDLQRLSSGRKM